ncbi:MAG: TetR/AcrR family transcriptional regulator [Pseudomonadota bacterium]
MVRTIAKDHDDKRRHILMVAAEVFAREGIARASMNEVAKACGISKANIYHYYSSKDDLLFDILDSYLSRLRNWICDLDMRGLIPEDQLGLVTREFLLAYEGMDNQHKIQGEGLPLLDKEKQDVLKNYQRDLVALVSRILRNCAPEALGHDTGRCRDVTMSVFGMLNWFYMWQPNATKEARISYAASITALTLHGIRGPDGPEQSVT